MTLVMAVNVGGSFCITTGDTRTIYLQSYESEGKLEIDKNINKKANDAKKSIFISDYVMFCAAGNSDISIYIRDELLKRANRSTTLIKSTLIIDDIVKEMKKEKNPPFFYRFLDEPDRFAVVLNGFNDDGESGFAYLISGYEETGYRTVEKGEYDHILLSPSGDYNEKKQQLLGKEMASGNIGLVRALNRMFKVHTTISYLQPNEVSSECDYKIIEWRKNKPKRKQGKKDVSLFYEKMELSDYNLNTLN
ncbi:hypothetical protein ACE38V_12820 [Cytobacillus sp. Hz8]|uniref:hypothetical protein n=1 Tax=Cytobacillus sp. Hz8 TaxID=3347168 RepID=UPI0035DD07D8